MQSGILAQFFHWLDNEKFGKIKCSHIVFFFFILFKCSEQIFCILLVQSTYQPSQEKRADAVEWKSEEHVTCQPPPPITCLLRQNVQLWWGRARRAFCLLSICCSYFNYKFIFYFCLNVLCHYQFINRTVISIK